MALLIFRDNIHKRAALFVRKVLFPIRQGKLMNLRFRMVSDTLKDIDEICIGIDAAHFAGDKQALKNADIFSTDFCPEEEPVFLT